MSQRAEWERHEQVRKVKSEPRCRVKGRDCNSKRMNWSYASWSITFQDAAKFESLLKIVELDAHVVDVYEVSVARVMVGPMVP